ncbi:hypothetical protein [Pannus brasiliensis]
MPKIPIEIIFFWRCRQNFFGWPAIGGRGTIPLSEDLQNIHRFAGQKVLLE